MHGPSDVAHLVDRHPSVTPERLIAQLVPPPTFADVGFDTYRPDPAEPSRRLLATYVDSGHVAYLDGAGNVEPARSIEPATSAAKEMAILEASGGGDDEDE